MILSHGSCPDAADSIIVIDRYVHDMPASVDTVIENFSDQSHVPWAHHGVAGDRCVRGDKTLHVGKCQTSGMKAWCPGIVQCC